MHCFFFACFFSLLAIIYAAGHEKSGCLEKEKALALLETAEGLLSKASDAFPSCKEDRNSTNTTDCEGEKPLAYIEISKKLISEVRENFPECSKSIEKDDKIVPKPIEKDNETTPKPVEKDDETTPKPMQKDDETTLKPIEKDDKTTPKPIEKDDETTPKSIEEEDITTPNPIVKDDNPKDCSEILASGRNESGVYTIWLNETITTEKPLQVYCDMNTDNGGWTLIQRRGKYAVQQDFYLDWENYKNGFGNLTEEFWLGNENIQVLCQNGCEIRFDLQDENGEKGFALYQDFRLLGNNYTLLISGYSGNVGDSMKEHNAFGFSTRDQGLTERAKFFHGGWWHRDRDYFSNLNGVFQPGVSRIDSALWFTWKKIYGLGSTEMKVRPHKK